MYWVNLSSTVNKIRGYLRSCVFINRISRRSGVFIDRISRRYVRGGFDRR